MDDEGLFQDGADGVAGVEGFRRVLEDHLEVPPVGLESPGRGMGEVDALENKGAAGGLIKADNGFPEGGLSAAGFADQSEGFARLESEGNIVDGFDAGGSKLEDTGFDGEVDPEIFDFEERPGLRTGYRGHG